MSNGMDDLMLPYPLAWSTTYLGVPSQFFRDADAADRARAEVERLNREYPHDKHKRSAKALYTADQLREYARQAVEAERRYTEADWRERLDRVRQGAAYKEAYFKLVEQLANLEAMRPSPPIYITRPPLD